MFSDDLDYDPRSELENALTVSRMEWQEKESQASAKINELVEAGRFVVVSSYPAYCPRTDAIMGEHLTLIADFATKEEAFNCAGQEGEKISCSEEEIRVMPFTPASAPIHVSQPLNDDEIPF
jgi:hypothetical protein